MDFALSHSYLIPLLPLLGAIISGFFGARWLRAHSHWPIWITVGLSMILSITLLVGMINQSSHDTAAAQTFVVPSDAAIHHTGNAGEAPVVVKPVVILGHAVHWYTWISVGNFRADAGAWIDPLTVIMLTVVTGVGWLITIYSKGYMAGDDGYFRFFAYMGLFIFSMTVLVMANNLLLMYLGWEGVGLCSYLLVAYFYAKPSAQNAGLKAFLVNRVGDLGFYIAMMLTFLAFGTLSFFGQGVGTHTGIIEQATTATGFQATLLYWIPFLLLFGATGKSAQIPLYVWLPDAMEGPTPVSALMHAATMVTAGVYMIARCSTLFINNQAAMLTIAVIGCATALFAATIAMRQFDLKKILAYSTVSQLAFMFVAVGVLAPVAGVFHLVTHAFFKGLLFLAAGVVMHALAGELDMRKFSGLKRTLPWTRWTMLIGCLALAGFPPFSGFWSKDEIIVASLDRNVVLGALMLLAAFLTAYYTFRLYFRAFEGPEVLPEIEHHEGHDHPREPWVMILPMLLLSVGAIFAGFINFPADWFADFLGKSPSMALGWLGLDHALPYASASQWGAGGVEHVHLTTMIISASVSLAGILVAYYFHLANRQAATRLSERMAGIASLLDHKYYIDEIYVACVVNPLRRLGALCSAFDTFVVDGLVWLTCFIPQAGGITLKYTVQRGSLQGYAVSMLFFIAVVLLLVFL